MTAGTAGMAGIADLDRLLAPISDEAPSGVWLRFEPVYDEIKRLREEDDPTLPQGIWQRELKRADWPGVAALCSEALESQTKDLQIAAWLTEAWIHLHGFPGLESGLRLLAGLCRGFWDDLYPVIDEDAEDGAEARLAPIEWAADRLQVPVRQVAITVPGDGGVPYDWMDWEAGAYLSNLARQDAEAAANAEAQGMVPQSRFLTSLAMTPASRLKALDGEIAAAFAALGELQEELDGRCGGTAPSLAGLGGTLSAIQAFVSRVLEERGEKKAAEVYAPGEWISPEPPAVDGETGRTGGTGGILSRADAYQRLGEAADYLLRSEPHSPVPYLVRRAIAWGNMSLAELLQELLQKNADLPTIYALLGMKRTS
jgi:type VI secretion system protein ImpA